MVAGEDSGDLLGADLIEALRARFPEARFAGVGGPRMRAVGFDAWHDIAELSVMGLAEVLRDLPRLLRLRAALARRLIGLHPDAFIGIDAPDFNLGLERKLKRAGIRTVHYVSPSVWAWRENRAAKIGAAADCVLCLFPMEPAIYARYGIDARFVGHPLADRFALAPDRDRACGELGLAPDRPVLAVLPGSRASEIRRLGAIFVDAARRIADAAPGLQVVIPAANPRCRAMIEALLARSGFGTRDASGRDPGPGTRDPAPGKAGVGATGAAGIGTQDPDSGNAAANGIDTPVGGTIGNASSSTQSGSDRRTSFEACSSGSRVPSPESRSLKPHAPGTVLLLDGQSDRAMIAADVVLLASGTAALEAMLAKRAMVVGYRIAPATYDAVRWLRLMNIDRYSLPNVLAGRTVVPELMQRDCTPEKLADAVLEWLGAPQRRAELAQEFERMHLALHAGGGAADSAARAIASLLPTASAPMQSHVDAH